MMKIIQKVVLSLSLAGLGVVTPGVAQASLHESVQSSPVVASSSVVTQAVTSSPGVTPISGVTIKDAVLCNLAKSEGSSYGKKSAGGKKYRLRPGSCMWAIYGCAANFGNYFTYMSGLYLSQGTCRKMTTSEAMFVNVA